MVNLVLFIDLSALVLNFNSVRGALESWSWSWSRKDITLVYKDLECQVLVFFFFFCL